MPIGIYRIPDNDAKELGYKEAYIMGEYVVEGDKIIIGRSIYDFVEDNLIEVDPKDFRDISGEKMRVAKELFGKYGIDVDVAFVVRTRKREKKKIVSIIGGKISV